MLRQPQFYDVCFFYILGYNMYKFLILNKT